MSKREIARLRGLVRHRRDRLEAGRFVVEGTKLVAEALAASHAVEKVVIDSDRIDEPAIDALVDAAHERDVEILELASHDVARIASTTAAQPVLAAVSYTHLTLPTTPYV